MDLGCKLFFMNKSCNVQRFYSYQVTDAETLITRNAYCPWLIDEIESYSCPYDKQERIFWMTFTIFALLS